MDAHTISLVQSTYQQIVPISSTAASLFYTKLFELDTSLKPMFKSDITEQGHKLMQMIGAAVKGLGHIDSLVPVVEQLGIRHVGYGVEEKHYDTVGVALIWTLKKGLAEDFTPEVEAAWIEVYTLLSDVMKSASHTAKAS